MNSGAKVLCIGGCNYDQKLFLSQAHIPGCSNPVTKHTCPGGVATNVATRLSRSLNITLISLVGKDNPGDYLLAQIAKKGIDTRWIIQQDNTHTGSYTAIISPRGEVISGYSDMRSSDALSSVDLQLQLQSANSLNGPFDWIFIDTNFSAEAIEVIAQFSQRHQIKLAADAVSVTKCLRLQPIIEQIDLLFSNQDELLKLTDTLNIDHAFKQLKQRGPKQWLTTKGKQGCQGYASEGEFSVASHAISQDDLVDCTGAGDSVAATVLQHMSRGLPLAEASQRAMLIAAEHIKQNSSTII